MKFSPILFSTVMVQAILAGNKSQTRRAIDINPKEWDLQRVYKPHLEKSVTALFTHKENPQLEKRIKFKWGKHYDTLWVREKWCKNQSGTGRPFHYFANNDTFTNPENERWKPSIHMPKIACRLFLEIENIFVEPLNNINRDDAIAEGITRDWDGNHYWYKDYLDKDHCHLIQNPVLSYKTLWTKINGPNNWKKNPYVWVIEFKVSEEQPKGFICD